MQNTVRDFWKMIVDRQCACVVMLCELEEGHQVGNFQCGYIEQQRVAMNSFKEASFRAIGISNKRLNEIH